MARTLAEKFDKLREAMSPDAQARAKVRADEMLAEISPVRASDHRPLWLRQKGYGFHMGRPDPPSDVSPVRASAQAMAADAAYADCMRNLTSAEAKAWNEHDYSVRWKWRAILLALDAAAEARGRQQAEQARDATTVKAIVDGEQSEDTATVNAVTAVVREADRAFEQSGGGSRHWVRDQFLPRLNKAGLVVADPCILVSEAKGRDEERERVTQHVELLNDEIRKMVEAASPFQCGGELEGVLPPGSSTVVDGLAWLFAQRAALTQALKDYGQHRKHCIYWTAHPLSEPHCTCGLDAALTGATK